jgi:two-component system CheB/CheR fusion protein
LEALERFLGQVPVPSGLAFVVVQHLDPTREGMMVELLQRATAMHVTQVTDGLPVQPNNVYVIPPNRDMTLGHGALHLHQPAEPRGLRLPIDLFFQSLAGDLKERGVAVVLSGMGSDGTLGLRAIKEQGGAVFVQVPASAKCDGMPRSAVDAGLADVVAPPEELPGRILAYLAHGRASAAHESVVDGRTLEEVGQVCTVLRGQTGHDFSLYKKNTVLRRVERRMGLHQLDSLTAYTRYLQESPQEAQLLFKELLIGVTRFFRDAPSWVQLEETLPELLAARSTTGQVRAWVPGCSTGEEAYSLAMVLHEAVMRTNRRGGFCLQVFGTDLDKDAVERARQGLYPAGIAADVSPGRLAKHFVQEEHGYRVSHDIRRLLTFAPHDVTRNPPFTRVDVLSCRNPDRSPHFSAPDDK